MDNKLKKITDKTLNKLAQNQIVLPSVYFKTFNEAAEELEIDVFDDNFKIEIDTILNDDFEKISDFMDKTIYNADSLTKAATDAQHAIKDKDESKLSQISKDLSELKKEVLKIKQLVFVDEVTNTLNRKWLFTRFLDENGNFKHSGSAALVFLNDYDTISKKYTLSIANNILVYIAKFLTKEFHKKELGIDIVKYSDNKFLLFYKDGDIQEFQSLLKEIKEAILKTTLQTKSGLQLKTKFDFTLQRFSPSKKFNVIFDSLMDKERG